MWYTYITQLYHGGNMYYYISYALCVEEFLTSPPPPPPFRIAEWQRSKIITLRISWEQLWK